MDAFGCALEEARRRAPLPRHPRPRPRAMPDHGPLRGWFPCAPEPAFQKGGIVPRVLKFWIGPDPHEVVVPLTREALEAIWRREAGARGELPDLPIIYGR